MKTSSNNVLIDKIYNHSLETFERLFINLNQIKKLCSSKTIIIKPNFAAGSYIAKNSHVVTDPIFLHTVVKYIRSLNSHAEIFIAESDSTQYGFAFLKFSNMGIDKWGIPGVTSLDVSRDIVEPVSHSNFRYFDNFNRQLWLSKTVLEADYILSTTNIKSHTITIFSGACKNLFGFLPTMNKERYHTEIHDVIHDLALVIKIDLSIVDGFFGLEKNGPVRGIPVNLGYRVFSNSPIVADIICCKAVGIDYKNVKYLKLLYSTYPSHIEEGVEKEIRLKISLPTLWQRIFNSTGLTLQSIGRFIYVMGNRIHCAESPLDFLIVLTKPILLTFFEVETLKKWKKKLFNQN